MRFATVVSGLPRSGTSLAMQMLAAGGLPPLCDDARPPDADNPRGYFEYAPVKALRRDASWLPKAEGRAVKIIHALLPALPPDRDTRVLLMRRPIAEVLVSQAVMLARAGEQDGGEPADALSEARLGELLECQLADALAWLSAQPRIAVLEVDYPALIADPDPQVARIDDFLGGGLDRAAMSAAVAPELRHHRL